MKVVEEVPLGKLMRKPVSSLNPKDHQEELFNYYSIPAYDEGAPIKEFGKEIGSSKKVLEKDDVLISRIVPHIQRVWIVDNNDSRTNIGSGEWIVFNTDKVLPEYLRYFLLSDVFHSQFMQTITGVGGSLMRANKKQTEKIKIPVCPFEQQKAIVAKLDRAQRLIDIDKVMLAKYDELIQSVFLEMFGDPVKNPKGWERAPFKKIAKIDKESFDPTDFNGSVEYVGLNSIVKNTGKIIDVETITKGDVKSNKYKFSPNHILYGKLRTYLNKVAFPNFNGVCSTDILPIKSKNGISTKFFVGYLLKTKEFVNYADKNSSGANLPRISPTMVKKFEAFLPPLELQRKFDDFVNKIISEKQQTIKASKKSEEMFSSLVQGVFG